MRAHMVVLGLLAWTDARAAQPGAPAAPQPTYVDPGARFGFTPPRDWRTLTPDEGRTLRGQSDQTIPAEFLDPQPPRFVVFGAIDRWLAGQFDGKALTALEIDGEPELTDAGIAGIRAHFEALSARGPERYAVERLALTSVGRSAHPALLGVVRISRDATSRTRFEAYVPTGGMTLSLALTWPSDDRAAGEAAFAELVAGLHLAAQPRGASRLGSKLLWAGLCGLGIGVVLHMVRKRAAS